MSPPSGVQINPRLFIFWIWDSVLTCRPIVGALINMLLVRMCFQAGLDKECASIQIHLWSLMLSIPHHHRHWLTSLSP